MAAMDDVEMEAYRLLVEPASPRGSRPASKMKPNTRFLRHIVREANHHNAALLAKESADAQRRLKNLMRNGKGDAEDDGDDDDASSKSRDGHGRDGKPKKTESARDNDRHAKKNSRRSEREDRGDKSSHSHHHRRTRDRDDRDDRDDKLQRRRSHRAHRENHSRSRERHDRHRSSKHRRRSRSPERAREGRLSRSPDCKFRDRSPHKKHRSRHHDEKELTSQRSSGRDRRDRGRSSKRAESSERSRSRSRSWPRSRSVSRSGSEGGSGSSASESDPLDEFVGPRLASDNARADKDRVRIRGRGAFSAAALGGLGSSIDRHFAADYDPLTDVEMQTEGTGLQQADSTGGGGSRGTTDDARAEMQRDRKQLLRDGAERLRAAGFTDKEIAIWSRGGRREVVDVPWAKKGEAREWDRGKVEGDDGPAKPLWAR